MADRVAFIGGSTAGRDHFPFPVLGLDPSYGPFGNHTAFPVSMDAATALTWWARVRRWHCHILVSYLFPVDDGAGGWVWSDEPLTGSVDFEFAIPLDPTNYSGASAPTREAELVTFNPIGADPSLTEYLNWNKGQDVAALYPAFGITDYAESFEDDNEPFFFVMAFPLTPYWHDDAITFQVEFAIFADGSSQSASSAVDETDHPILISAEAVSIFSETPEQFPAFSFGLRATDPGDAEIGVIKFHGDTHIDLYPAEYWAYANNSGSPVYNTATGEQLVDPLS